MTNKKNSNEGKNILNSKLDNLNEANASTENNNSHLNIKVIHDEKYIEKGKDIILTLSDKNILDENDQLENIELLNEEKRWNKNEKALNELDKITADESILSQYDDSNSKGFKLSHMGALNIGNGEFVELKLGQNVGTDYLSLEELKRKKSKSKKSGRKRKRSEMESENNESVNNDQISTNIEDLSHIINQDFNAERKNALLEKEKSRRMAYDFSVQKAQQLSSINLEAMNDDIDDDALYRLNKTKNRIDNQSLNVLSQTKKLEQSINKETEERNDITFTPILNAPTQEDESEDQFSSIAQRKRKIHSLRSRTINTEDENIQEELEMKKEESDNELNYKPITQTILKEPILNRGLYNAIVFSRQKGFFKVHAEPTSLISEDSIEKKKEEFKKLNYAFYGMTKSKSKLERERKKKERQGRIQGMNASDTPLNALQALKNAQEASGSAFISIGKSMDVLSTAVAAHKLARQKKLIEKMKSES